MFLYMYFYRCKDVVEIIENLIVRESESGYSMFFEEICITLIVVFFLRCRLMNPTIDLYGKMTFGTVEVEYGSRLHELSLKAYAEIVITNSLPEQSLSFRWVVSHLSREEQHISWSA